MGLLPSITRQKYLAEHIYYSHESKSQFKRVGFIILFSSHNMGGAL